MSRLRACVIGAGEMGSNHVRALSGLSTVELVGVADRDEDALALATHGRTVLGSTDARVMLEETSPDITVVAVPTLLHEEIATMALAAGSHVLVEKPVAADIASARRLKDAAAQAGRTVMVGHIERFNPVITELKRRLADGALGRVFQVTARRTGLFPRRVKDVGVIKDLATHDLDVIRYVCDSPFEMVFAQSAQHLHEGHEDLAAAQARLADGTVVVLDVNWLAPTKERELRILGEGGMFIADYVRQDLAFFGNRNLSERSHPGTGITGMVEGEITHYPIDREEPLIAELRACINAIEQGGPPPVSLDDGIEALLLAEAALRSAEIGEPVRPNSQTGAP